MIRRLCVPFDMQTDLLKTSGHGRACFVNLSDFDNRHRIALALMILCLRAALRRAAGVNVVLFCRKGISLQGEPVEHAIRKGQPESGGSHALRLRQAANSRSASRNYLRIPARQAGTTCACHRTSSLHSPITRNPQWVDTHRSPQPNATASFLRRISLCR